MPSLQISEDKRWRWCLRRHQLLYTLYKDSIIEQMKGRRSTLCPYTNVCILFVILYVGSQEKDYTCACNLLQSALYSLTFVKVWFDNGGDKDRASISILLNCGTSCNEENCIGNTATNSYRLRLLLLKGYLSVWGNSQMDEAAQYAPPPLCLPLPLWLWYVSALHHTVSWRRQPIVIWSPILVLPFGCSKPLQT